jgi:hypothetical protein
MIASSIRRHWHTIAAKGTWPGENKTFRNVNCNWSPRKKWSQMRAFGSVNPVLPTFEPIKLREIGHRLT